MTELTNDLMPGELAYSGQEDSARTAYNAEVTASIIPGRFVAISAAGDGQLERRGVTLPVDANSIIVGVCKRYFLEDEHLPKHPLSYYFRGVVSVECVATVTPQQQVYAIFTPGATQGKATNVAGINAVIVPGARFLASSAANAIAIVTLLLP